VIIDIGDGEQRVLFIMNHATSKRILDRPYEEVKDSKDVKQGDFAIDKDGYIARFELSNYNTSVWWREKWSPRYRHLHYRDVKPHKMNGIWYWAVLAEDIADPTLHIQTLKKRQDKATGQWWILVRFKHLAKPYEHWLKQEEAIQIRDALSEMIDWKPAPKVEIDPLIALKEEADKLLNKESE